MLLRLVPAVAAATHTGKTDSMRTVVYDRYGPPDVLRLEEVERPVPKDDEVLVKIHASTVNRLDVHTREANVKSGPAVSFLSRLVSGVRRPRRRVLGSEFAGEVVAVGPAVTGFAAGVTWFVVKIFPTGKKKPPPEPETS